MTYPEGWKPECKQDVVDLLMKVQVGNISCRRASDILFPEFNNSIAEQNKKIDKDAEEYYNNVYNEWYPLWEDLVEDRKNYYRSIVIRNNI